MIGPFRRRIGVGFAVAAIFGAMTAFAVAWNSQAMSAVLCGLFGVGLLGYAMWKSPSRSLRVLPAELAEDNQANWGLSADSARVSAAVFYCDMLAIACYWGGLVILLGYGLTGLYWQHWWQYAPAMLLLGEIFRNIGNFLERVQASPDAATRVRPLLDRLTILTLMQAVAIGGGLAWLVVSGKINPAKPDWLANHVFLAGGLALTLLSLLSVRDQRRLSSY